MKRLFLIIVATTFITGCVYSERRTPYGYSSSYSTVTPVYPRYQEQHYYIQTPRYVPPPKPYFRAYEEERHEHENHSHHRSHHERDEHDERSNSRSHHRW